MIGGCKHLHACRDAVPKVVLRDHQVKWGVKVKGKVGVVG